MREIRQSGSEGGVAGNSHPYPYREPRVGGCCRGGQLQRWGGVGLAGAAGAWGTTGAAGAQGVELSDPDRRSDRELGFHASEP
jgi:hypothetical protein